MGIARWVAAGLPAGVWSGTLRKAAEEQVPGQDDRIGLVLSERYKLERFASEELLGRVYAARDLVRDRRVQVKILHPHFGEDDPRFGRFLREVRASSMVRHPNTIEMLDSGTDHGLHYIVFEYFEAHTLEEELAQGPLSVARTAHIAAQIASAIGAAHQENVTHRALSPRNVLLLDDSPRGDFVKIRDFGLSKLERFTQDEEASHLTEAGVRVGNTAYMAPEYIERDRFHPKGDLYALGCLMMTMLTGEPPFTGKAAAVLGDHVATPPPRVSDRRPDIPEWLDDLVDELLAKAPEARPGAYQVVSRLEEGIGHRLEPPGLGKAGPPAAPKSTEKSEREFPIAVVAVIALALSAIAALMGLLLVGAILLALASRSEAPPHRAETPVPVVPPAPTPSPEQPAATRPAPAPAPKTEVEPPNFTEPARRSEIKVTCNRKALVLIDGSPKGTTPYVGPVFPGIHRVAVMLPGKPETRQERKVEVKRGQQAWLVFTF